MGRRNFWLKNFAFSLDCALISALLCAMTITPPTGTSIQNPSRPPLNEEASPLQITASQLLASGEDSKVTETPAEMGIVQTQSESTLGLAGKFSLTLLAGGVLMGGAGLPVSLCVLSMPLLAAAIAGLAGACILGSILTAIVALVEPSNRSSMGRLQDGQNGTVVPDSGAKLARQEFEVLAIGGQSLLEKLLEVQARLLKEQQAIRAQYETVLKETSQLKEAQLKNEAVTEKLTKLPESLERAVASDFSVKMAALDAKLSELNERDAEVTANSYMAAESATELENLKEKVKSTETALADSEQRRVALERDLAKITAALNQDAVATLSAKLNQLETALTESQKGEKSLEANLAEIKDMLKQDMEATLPEKFNGLETALAASKQGTETLETGLSEIKEMLQRTLITLPEEVGTLAGKLAQSEAEKASFRESLDALNQVMNEQLSINNKLTNQVKELEKALTEEQERRALFDQRLVKPNGSPQPNSVALPRQSSSDIESRENSPIVAANGRSSSESSQMFTDNSLDVFSPLSTKEDLTPRAMPLGPKDSCSDEELSSVEGIFEEIQGPDRLPSKNGKRSSSKQESLLRGPVEKGDETVE